jgi:hypothetical protein
MVEGSKFNESHVLKILSWGAKKGGMPRPFSITLPKPSGLVPFWACFRFPIPGKSCRYASRYKALIYFLI